MSKKFPSKFNKQFEKAPRIDPSIKESAISKNPVWQVGIIDLDGPWGWESIDKNLLIRDILPKIQNFESMLWSGILGNKSHEVPVNKIDKKAQKRLIFLKLDDFETLVSLRLTGLQRLWGIKINNVLKILWWDPNHEVYPSQKKHT